MTRGKGFDSVTDLGLVGTCADLFDGKHDVLVSRANRALRDDRHTDGQKMWSQPSDRLFQNDAQEGASHERIGQSKYGVRRVAKISKPNLGNQDDPDGGGDGHERGSQGGEYGFLIRIGKLRPHDISRIREEGDGE